MAALCAALLPSIAQGDCLTPDEATTIMLTRHPYLRAINLVGAEAQSFLTGYNAQPPATNWRADQVLIFDARGLRNVEVVLFTQGCMSAHGVLPATTVEPLLSSPG